MAAWLEERGLILNEKKSQVLTVFPGRDAGPRVTVLCRSQALPTVTSAKYLGVIIDEGLNFQQHLKAITARVSRKVGALWRTRRCLSLAARVTYLKSVVMPDLTYASSCFLFCLTAQQATDLQTLENQSGSRSFWRSAIRLCSTSAPTGGTLPNLRVAQAKGAIAHLAMHPRHCGEPALWTDFKVTRSAYPLAEGHRSAHTTRRKPRWSG